MGRKLASAIAKKPPLQDAESLLYMVIVFDFNYNS